jgi:hypothetical protein
LSSGKPSSMTLLDAHKRVLAQILGVRRTIPEEIINCELDIFSLWSTWILRMARFWNNIPAMRPDSLHYKVLMHDIKLAIVEGRETFSGTLLQQLKKLGYYIADHVRFDRALQIDISHVKDLLDRKSDMTWDDLDISPRSCASPRSLEPYSADTKGGSHVRLMYHGVRVRSNSTFLIVDCEPVCDLD